MDPTPLPLSTGDHLDRNVNSRAGPPERSLPRWIGPLLWVVSVVAIFGPFLVFPVTREAGSNAGDETSLVAILRAFNRALTATGWGDGGRLLIWGFAGTALIGAMTLLWIAFVDEG